MEAKERIILALDVEHFEEARRIVLDFKDEVGMFKVGNQLFTHCGPKIVDFIKMRGSKVFLDLKYHDIPNTVAKATAEAVKLGADILNVHAIGGLSMMMAAREALYETAKNYRIDRPKLIAVTVLTSIDEMELRRMGIDIEIQILTENLALLAKEAGLDGVVAAGADIEMIREACGKDFIIVTPGVRISARGDDQKRTISPIEAIAKGATYIVLGRTLMDSNDPKALLKRISMEIR